MANINKIEAIWIRVPLKQDFRGSVYGVHEKNAILTRVYTDDGRMGQCINGEGAAEIHRQALEILQKAVIPQLVGEDARAIERLWTKMWRITSLSRWDRKAAVRAVACIDSALWDRLGQEAGLPLYRLWGGASDRLPIIAIGGQYRDDYTLEDYGREIEEFKQLGLAGCKFKVGGMSPEDDARRTEAASRAGGENFILCVDANRGWSRKQAQEFWRLTRHLSLRWFEEPCHWHNDRKDMAIFRQITGLPVAAGQSEISAEGCRDLITEGAIDICNLDASWGGGPTAWLRVAKMAACFGVEMAHHGEPIVGSHLLAAVQNGTYVETHHPDRDPVFHQMISGRGQIADGYYTLPTAPGWGVDYDPDFIARYRVNSAHAT